jgi:DNA-binding MarR family transcriptional regulator
MTVYDSKAGSMAAKAVLAYLASIKTETAHASVKEIAAAVECDRDTVSKALAALSEQGLIEVTGSKLKGETRARVFRLLTRKPDEA